MRSTRQHARRTEQEATIDDTEEDTHVFNTMPDGTPPPGDQGWEHGNLAEENDELPQYDNPAEANDVDELPYNELPENLSASDSDGIAEITEAAFMEATGETLFASAETSAEAALRFRTSAEAAAAERTAEAAAENTAGDIIKENIENLKQLFEMSLTDMRNLMDTQAAIAETRAETRARDREDLFQAATAERIANTAEFTNKAAVQHMVAAQVERQLQETETKRQNDIEQADARLAAREALYPATSKYTTVHPIMMVTPVGIGCNTLSPGSVKREDIPAGRFGLQTSTQDHLSYRILYNSFYATHATMTTTPADDAILQSDDAEAQIECLRNIVNEICLIRRVNKNVVNIMTNDLAHAVLLTPEGMLEARKNQIYVVDLEFAEEPRAKARRMDPAYIANQPQHGLTLSETVLDQSKLLSPNLGKAITMIATALEHLNGGLYSGEGNVAAKVKAMMTLMNALSAAAVTWWPIHYLVAIPGMLQGATQYDVEAQSLCIHLPLSERMALYSLLMMVTTGRARLLLQTECPPNIQSVYSDGPLGMQRLCQQVYESSKSLQVELNAKLPMVHFGKDDPASTIRFFKETFNTLDFITPEGARMTELQRNTIVWGAVPMLNDSTFWHPVRTDIIKVYGDKVPPRSLIYVTVMKYHDRHASTPATAATLIRHVNQSGELVMPNKGSITTDSSRSREGPRAYYADGNSSRRSHMQMPPPTRHEHAMMANSDASSEDDENDSQGDDEQRAMYSQDVHFDDGPVDSSEHIHHNGAVNGAFYGYGEPSSHQGGRNSTLRMNTQANAGQAQTFRRKSNIPQPRQQANDSHIQQGMVNNWTNDRNKSIRQSTPMSTQGATRPTGSGTMMVRPRLQGNDSVRLGEKRTPSTPRNGMLARTRGMQNTYHAENERKRDRCYRCGEQGHQAHECTNPPQAQHRGNSTGTNNPRSAARHPQRAHPNQNQQRGFYASDSLCEQEEEEEYASFQGEHGYPAFNNSDNETTQLVETSDDESCNDAPGQDNDEKECALHLSSITHEFAPQHESSFEYSNVVDKLALLAHTSPGAAITPTSDPEYDDTVYEGAYAIAEEYGLMGILSSIVDLEQNKTNDDDMLMASPSQHDTLDEREISLRFKKRTRAFQEKLPNTAGQSSGQACHSDNEHKAYKSGSARRKDRQRAKAANQAREATARDNEARQASNLAREATVRDNEARQSRNNKAAQSSKPHSVPKHPVQDHHRDRHRSMTKQPVQSEAIERTRHPGKHQKLPERSVNPVNDARSRPLDRQARRSLNIHDEKTTSEEIIYVRHSQGQMRRTRDPIVFAYRNDGTARTINANFVEEAMPTQLGPITVAYTRADLDGEYNRSVVHPYNDKSHQYECGTWYEGGFTPQQDGAHGPWGGDGRCTFHAIKTATGLEWMQDAQRMPFKTQEARLRLDCRIAFAAQRENRATHPIKPSLRSTRISKAKTPPSSSPKSDVYSDDTSEIATTNISSQSSLLSERTRRNSPNLLEIQTRPQDTAQSSLSGAETQVYGRRSASPGQNASPTISSEATRMRGIPMNILPPPHMRDSLTPEMRIFDISQSHHNAPRKKDTDIWTSEQPRTSSARRCRR
jgi:hypothetical protein